MIGLLVIDALFALPFGFTLLGRVISALIVIGMVLVLIKYFSERISIEGDTVILTTGILSQQTTEIPLAKINAVTIKRGIFGRMLDFGTLVVFTGNDTSGIKFVGLGRPDEVKRRLKH